MIDIKKITKGKNDYIDILLIADPSKKAIEKYIGDSDLFVLYDNDEPVCAATVVEVSGDNCELKNIASVKQGRGYGSKMLKFLFEHYKNKYPNMVVGTGNSSIQNIQFYEKNGFKITHQIDNFFVDMYDEPIFENGIQCVHMVRLKKSL